MPDSVNKEIAELLGWRQPVIPEGCRSDWWIRPDDGAVVPSSAMPLFDSDPAASMELLESCQSFSADRLDVFGWRVALTAKPGMRGRGQKQTLEAAVAAAWRAAMKGKKGA